MRSFACLLFCSMIITHTAQAASTGYWSSFATQTTDPVGAKNGAISGAFAQGYTREEAIKKALEQCRSGGKSPQKCETYGTFNSGCLYIALGSAPWGPVGGANGRTPQEAYDKCHAEGLDCGIPVMGGCANPSESLPLGAIKKAPKVRYSVGLAAGRGSSSSRDFISVGAAKGPTEAVAKQRAVAFCNSNYSNGEVSCSSVHAFSKGCGFIAHAYKNPNGDGLGWAVGKTAQEAYDKCRANGSLCRAETQGFCVE